MELREEIMNDWKNKKKELTNIFANKKTLLWRMIRDKNEYKKINLGDGVYFFTQRTREDTFIIMDLPNLKYRHFFEHCDCKRIIKIAIPLRTDKESKIERTYSDLFEVFGACAYAAEENFIMQMNTEQIIGFYKNFLSVYENRYVYKEIIEKKLGEGYLKNKEIEMQFLKELKKEKIKIKI